VYRSRSSQGSLSSMALWEGLEVHVALSRPPPTNVIVERVRLQDQPRLRRLGLMCRSSGQQTATEERESRLRHASSGQQDSGTSSSARPSGDDVAAPERNQ